MPCRSGGSLYLHAKPQLLYPPKPISHASDFAMSVGDVKISILFMSIPRVDTCWRRVIHSFRSCVSHGCNFCLPNCLHILSLNLRHERKYLPTRMMNPAWLRQPMQDSISLVATDVCDRRSSMSLIHFCALSMGKKILNDQVLMSHPRTVLVSLGNPSMWYFVCCTALFCLTFLLCETGLKIACAMRGPAWRILSLLLLISSPHVILSSM